jgi:hypothetical protein
MGFLYPSHVLSLLKRIKEISKIYGHFTPKRTFVKDDIRGEGVRGQGPGFRAWPPMQCGGVGGQKVRR